MNSASKSGAAIRDASPRAKPGHDCRTESRSRRTTVTLSPESQEIVERFRGANGSSVSAAIDEIIQRSEPRPSRLSEVNGFLVLDLPAGDRHFTLEDIKQAEDDMDREYVEGILYRDRKTAPRKKKTDRRQ